MRGGGGGGGQQLPSSCGPPAAGPPPMLCGDGGRGRPTDRGRRTHDTVTAGWSNQKCAHRAFARKEKHTLSDPKPHQNSSSYKQRGEERRGERVCKLCCGQELTQKGPNPCTSDYNAWASGLRRRPLGRRSSKKQHHGPAFGPQKRHDALLLAGIY